jgi:hypothetical protein
MDYIVEVATREGLISERYATYEEAKRRVDALPADTILGIPFIFRELPDGSQRLVREDGKPLQWHRLEEDKDAVIEEIVPLSDDLPAGTGPLIRPIEPRKDDLEEGEPGA